MKIKSMKDSGAKLVTNWANGELAHQNITLAAYYLWDQEGRQEGRSLDHWLRAQETSSRTGKESGIHV